MPLTEREEWLAEFLDFVSACVLLFGLTCALYLYFGLWGGLSPGLRTSMAVYAVIVTGVLVTILDREEAGFMERGLYD